ncbi:MAG TPA: hypothetical protein VKU02_17250, partial [Gemmataceae bacterium]|nr:hypothetical protein [Gemmataceae bacterium]
MSATKSRRPTPRRLVTATVILLAAASLAAISSWWLRAPQALAPPQMDLSNVDRAVRRAVESARTAILDRPDSAEAWGKLGMILMAHGLPVTASTACLTQAERLDPRQPRWP